jgi:hypothetical protein
MDHDHPDPTANDIVYLLLYEAQNHHMVDNRLLYAGALMMRAAAEIEALRAKLNAPETRE